MNPATVTSLVDIKPHTKQLVYDLVQQADLDTSEWKKFKGKNPATNPKFCYNWAFWDAKEDNIVICLWYEQMEQKSGVISRWLNMRNVATEADLQTSQSARSKRAHEMDRAFQLATVRNLPIRVIIASGSRRGEDGADSSHVALRSLDSAPWFVSSYSWDSGDCFLVRGSSAHSNAFKWAIRLTWMDPESKGYSAILPLELFSTLTPKLGVVHDTRGPKGGKARAKCNIRIENLHAELDYSQFPGFNNGQDMLLGIARIHFTNSQRNVVSKVEWSDRQTRNFKACEFDFSLINTNSHPETTIDRGKNWLGHRLDSDAAQLDEMLLKGASMADLKKARGAIHQHIKHLRDKWGIDCVREGEVYRMRFTQGSAPEKAPVAVSISAVRFRKAFDRFQSLSLKKNGELLLSFREPDTLAYDGENYKTGIPEAAKLLLNVSTWKQAQIGTGEIIAAVIRAIAIKGNNLLQWEGRHGPDSRVHINLVNVEADTTVCTSIETAFFNLYRKGEANRQIFDTIVEHCGRRYELVAYLFFIAEPHRFLPVRTRSFDKAFVELGVDLVTQGSCGWENYNSYCDVIREVQRCLIGEGIADATLLDAHSFCWILARSSEDEPPAQIIPPAPPEPFTGSLKFAVTNQNFTPKDDAAIRDMQAEAQKRQASGVVAEEIAFKSECERLMRAGRPDLIVNVEPVSNKPGLGYDIKSVEIDGRERFIEVKNVTKGSRFFLSQNEWLTSQHPKNNYWFYLVHENSAGAPKVTHMAASELTTAHLNPTQYMVCFKA